MLGGWRRKLILEGRTCGEKEPAQRAGAGAWEPALTSTGYIQLEGCKTAAEGPCRCRIIKACANHAVESGVDEAASDCYQLPSSLAIIPFLFRP